MSENLRKKFNIPDHFTRDWKLTTWMRAHLGMTDLEGVYFDDEPIDVRDGLTQAGTTVYGAMWFVFPDRMVEVSHGIDHIQFEKQP